MIFFEIAALMYAANILALAIKEKKRDEYLEVIWEDTVDLKDLL